MMDHYRTGKRIGALSWVLIVAFLLTSLGQVNGVVLAQEEAPTETPIATVEIPTPETIETPEITVEPTEVLATETPVEPEPTETDTVAATEEESSEVEALEGAPANDLIPNAVVMALDTVYTANSAGATISSVSEGDELADPVNVCNTGDTYSLWYEFTAPTEGVYIVNTYGSNRYASRNLTVLEKVNTTTRTPVVCGDINQDGIDYEDYFSLSFYGTENTTYLLGISGTLDGDPIVIKVEKPECESGHICGAAIDGDGSVIHWPYYRVHDDEGWVYTNQNTGDYSSFFSIDLSAYASAQYTLVVDGGKSLIFNKNVTSPGFSNASAVGYQKVLVDTKNTSGEYFKPGLFIISRTQDNLGDFLYLDSNKISNPQEFYLAPGQYNIEAISDSGLLQIFQPGVFVVESETSQTIGLNAQELPADTFKFVLDGLDGAKISFATQSYSYGVDLDKDDIVTFAAPSGEKISYINAEMLVNDESGKEWDYISPLGWNVPIVGGLEHEFTIGGALSFQVNVEDNIAYIEDAGGELNTNLVDEHGNRLSYIYGYAEGETSKSYLPINFNIFDPDKVLVATDSVTSFYYPQQFSIPMDKGLGIWTVDASVDLGPLGGLQTASATFSVDSLANHPVVNDDFDSANIIDSMPYSLEGFNTRGSTSTSDDPKLEGMPSDWWGNSVWFKYTPAQNGTLTLDTIGQNYGTLLTVWKGNRGALSNVAVNDNYYDPDTDEYEPYSQVSFPVSAGQTYYIMVQGFVGFGSQGYGKLNLHGSLAANPKCYSLSVSSNSTTYGSVQVLTAPNCGTQYSEGTKVTLSAVAKPTFGFYNWSDGSTDDPYQVTITAETVLKANFVKMIAPVITAPAAGALINDASPSFSWGDTQFADTYQIQIDSQSSFTLPIDQDETVDTFTYESPALTPDGVKYYRVRAINAYGDAGPWSAVRSFTLDTQAPAAPSLTAPTDVAWIVGVPSYTWTAVAGANAYRFEYDSAADFAHPTASALLSSTSYKPLEQTPGTYFWRVWARDAAGNWSVSPSGAYTVTVLAAVPPAPKITPFASGPLTNSATPNITWGRVYFANTYTFQIGTNAAFSGELLINETLDADTLNYEFTAPNDGDYYARVRALNSANEASPWSAVYKITVDTLAPGMPTLVSPIQASYPGKTTPKLTLAAVGSAKTYDYQVDEVDSFESPLISVSSSATSYSTTASQALPLGLLYWRARAVDAAGNPSPWSTPQSFYQTNLKTPNTSVVVLVAKPTFAWSALSGATGYRLSVCSDKLMTDCILDLPLGVVTNYISPVSFSPAVYYWQIKVIGGTYDGQVTPQMMFSVSPTTPNAPTPSYPANGAYLSDVTPVLSWTAIPTAAYYEVEINLSPTFSAGGYDLTEEDAWLETAPLVQGKYYWRVRAIDANGAFSKWSAVFNFAIDTTAPDKPTLVGPTNGSLVISQLPKLTLTPVTGAKLYEYQASVLADFSTVILDKTTSAASYTLVNGQQLPLGKIYWRAQVIDPANNVSGWSEVGNFLVTNQKTPADRSFTTSVQPAFTWIAIPNTAFYSIKVCKDFGQTDCLIDTNLTPVTGYKPVAPLDAGKYYWQLTVQPIGGGESMKTPILSFTVTPVGLPAPILSSPVVNFITNDTTVELTWQAVSEASNYEVQISQAVSFAALVGSTTQPGTTYISESLPDGRYYWRVRSLNTYDAPGSWSVVRNFTVDTHETAAPSLISPAGMALVNTLTPKLSLKTISGAKNYQYQVYTTGSPDEIWADATVSTPTYTFTLAQSLPFGRFSWRARTIDAAGNVSAWSDPVDFVVTLQKSPLNVSYTKVPNTTFTWAALPGVTGYRVKVCKDAALATDCISSGDLAATTLKFILPTPLSDGVHYWRIEVLGSTLADPFTPVLSFTKVH